MCMQVDYHPDGQIGPYLVMDAAGWVGFEIGAKKILTLEFLP